MGYLHPDVYDFGLSELADGNALHICSQQPASYAEVATYSLGNKAAPTISAPQAGSPDGRQVTVSAITDGTVTTTGTGSHYALIDSTTSRLLAAGLLNAPVSLTSTSQPFTLTTTVIRIPAPG